MAVSAVGIAAALTAWRGTPLRAQGTRPAGIQSISICSPAGAAGKGSCPAGAFDTKQLVLGTNGSSINRAGAFGPIPDEHSSVFAPGTLGANQDYLFFLATGTTGNPGIGVTVLSGGAGPGKNGQWALDFPKGYGNYPGGFGQVFNTAMRPGVCPAVADGNPAHQDQTFDTHYASAGSVMIDPTGAPGSLLMIYEGTNGCIGTTGGTSGNAGTGNAYISLAVATSLDYGKSWPTYRGTPTFSFVPMPDTNPTQAPNAPMGAMGRNVCMGNDCVSTPPANYGRYAVITAPTSLASLMAAGKPLTATFGEQEIAGFIDDVSGAAAPYVYATFGDVREGRAQLGGSAPLSFKKWDGQGFNAPGIGGVEAAVIPAGPFENCEALAQAQFGASISYVDDTQQYLLTFVCISPNDPALGKGGAGNRGAAWFYSTSYDLSDPTQWSAPKEITGSWSEFDPSGGCESYDGWYPTFMSLRKKPAHLSTSGYVFYLWGCQTGGTPSPGRQFSARQFTITTGTASPALTSGSLANGATYASGGLVPGSWAQVKGAGLSPVSRTWGPAEFQGLGNKLPTSLNGVSVMVNNLPAAVYFVDPAQISFQVPNGVSGTAAVQVINNGQTSNTITAPAATNSPGIFPVIVNGTNYPAGVFLDGKYVGDPAVNAAFRKAKPGDVIQLYATGLVSTPAGVLPSLQLVSGVTVTIGTTTVPASFAGLVAAGEFQINFTVPQLSDGVYPISITANGVASPENINTKPPAPLVIPIQH